MPASSTLHGSPSLKLGYLVGFQVLVCALGAQAEDLSDLTERAEGGDAEAQLDLGLMYEYRDGVTQDYGQALNWYRKAADQGAADGSNGVAWLLSTCPNDKIRNGPQAIKYAEEALSKATSEEHFAMIVDTLAAAYAETGRFEEAIRTQEHAIAKLDKGHPLLPELLKHLESYESAKPWREDFPFGSGIDWVSLIQKTVIALVLLLALIALVIGLAEYLNRSRL